MERKGINLGRATLIVLLVVSFFAVGYAASSVYQHFAYPPPEFEATIRHTYKNHERVSLWVVSVRADGAWSQGHDPEKPTVIVNPNTKVETVIDYNLGIYTKGLVSDTMAERLLRGRYATCERAFFNDKQGRSVVCEDTQEKWNGYNLVHVKIKTGARNPAASGPMSMEEDIFAVRELNWLRVKETDYINGEETKVTEVVDFRLLTNSPNRFTVPPGLTKKGLANFHYARNCANGNCQASEKVMEGWKKKEQDMEAQARQTGNIEWMK